jgi:hypothetical protein
MSASASSFFFPISSITYPTFSNFDSSFTRSFKVNILAWLSSLSQPILFSSLSFSSMIEASCSEKARADSENTLVRCDACLTWLR